MSIWEYKKDGGRPTEEIIETKVCLFCGTKLIQIKHSYEKVEEHSIFHIWNNDVRVCSNCGWWRVYKGEGQRGAAELLDITYGAFASLKNLDIQSNIEQPLEEVQSYLLAKYESRFSIHPRLLEKVVGSVFSNLGYWTQVTGYSNDGGIDVILEGKNGQSVGVQVKRYKDSIKVEQIRSLAGALLLGGYTQGIFITTSTFQSGAEKAADLSSFRGIPIELMDATKFLDALKISHRPIYTNIEEWEQSVGKYELSLVSFYNA